MSEIKRTVQVRFFTTIQDAESHVPDMPFSVPITFKRWALSELVNKLLQQSPAQPYDFLHEGQFIRSDLSTYLEKKGLSEEVELVLEYVEVFEPPQEPSDLTLPDWISSVDALNSSTYTLTGCYDGVARIIGNDNNIITLAEGHESAITCVKLMNKGNPVRSNNNQEEEQPSGLYFVSGSKDKTVRAWKWDHKSNKCQEVARSVAAPSEEITSGHYNSIQCIDVVDTVNSSRFASGDYSGRIVMWDITHSHEEEVETGKRNKKTTTNVNFLTPLRVIEAHSQCVSAICWPHPLALYTASYDYSLKLWDTTTGSNTSFWYSKCSFTSLKYSSDTNLLASGHTDNAIRIWDPRKSGIEAMKLVLKSHTSWVSDVSWAPELNNAHPYITSSSYDGTIKVWDLRASIPLSTIRTHDDKVLSVDWHVNDDDKVQIVSGGADTKLKFHTFEKL